ncbi:hypothetical protein CEP54_012285 [Fusarium duplospermum]|uniref:Uncharacterized protein n=1 Tax=Fusarium duplospermum TaxID=1325734 RepID=A0A428P9E0_9HYPO|nr:hypothetical protein CEP54_012285 [Fusarium duplospermum]
MPPAHKPVSPNRPVTLHPRSGANGNQGESSRLEFGESVKLSLADFKLDGLSTVDRTRAQNFVMIFNIIKICLLKPLADELAEFLPKAWEQSLPPKSSLPTEHGFYKRMRGTERNQKELYYPYWFFLAVTWGAFHPDLSPIRKDMAALWGLDSPHSFIFYPTGIPVGRHTALFHGGLQDPTPLCEIQRRAQGFKAAIEGAGNPSVIEAVKEYAPTLLNKAAHTDDMESLHRKLKDTHEQLQKTQGQLKETQKRLQETNDELQKTRKKLKNDTENSNKDLAAVNRRVDKVVDTCALVLSILTTPGGEKRKLNPEQDGA